MTEYLNTVVNPAAPWSFIPDTKENILQDLAEHTLDPVFENYGNFVYSPVFQNEALNKKYNGCTMIAGNFLTYSHAFRVITDDKKLISVLEAAIRQNQDADEYRAAKQRMEERKKLCRN